MNLLGSFLIALSMYSKIPVPQVEWTKERMKYAMCFFPLIGLITGAVLVLFIWLAKRLGGRELFIALGGAAVPLLVTGGIHMDGFLDVTDARRSYGSREKKLEILKDPHTGAFAIIGLGVYLLLYGAAFSELEFSDICLLSYVFVAERALSGLSVVSFPKAKKDGLAAEFSGKAKTKTVQFIMAAYLAAAAAGIMQAGAISGIICIVTAVMVFCYYYRMTVKEFGGMTGDLAGYFLQIFELALIIAMAACRLAGLR